MQHAAIAQYNEPLIETIAVGTRVIQNLLAHFARVSKISALSASSVIGSTSVFGGGPANLTPLSRTTQRTSMVLL
jgi:hypothetical protein